MYPSGCDTAPIAKNGTQINTSTTPGWGILQDNTQCQQGCRVSSGVYSTTEACGSGGSNRNVQRISVYELGTGPVSGFLNNACVLKLELLYLFPFCCGSIRHDAGERTTSNTDHISMEQKCEEAGRWECTRSGWRGFVAACKSQGIVAGGIMKPKTSTTLAHHVEILVEAHCGFARYQLQDDSTKQDSSVYQHSNSLDIC